MELSVKSAINAGDTFFLKFKDLYNPQTTKPTDTFTVRIVNTNQYEIAETPATFSYGIEVEEPAPLTTYSMTAMEHRHLTYTSLVISFKPAH